VKRQPVYHRARRAAVLLLPGIKHLSYPPTVTVFAGDTLYMWRLLGLAVLYCTSKMADAAVPVCPSTPVPRAAHSIKFSPTVAVGKPVSYAGGNKGKKHGEVLKVSLAVSPA
jgi:hypothetical protein